MVKIKVYEIDLNTSRDLVTKMREYKDAQKAIEVARLYNRLFNNTNKIAVIREK